MVGGGWGVLELGAAAVDDGVGGGEGREREKGEREEEEERAAQAHFLGCGNWP